MSHETYGIRTRLTGWIAMPRRGTAGADELGRAIFGASNQPSALGAIGGATATIAGFALPWQMTASKDGWSLTVAALICMAIGARLGSKLDLRGTGSAILVVIATSLVAVAWSLGCGPLASGLDARSAALCAAGLSLAILTASLICYGAIAGLALAGDLATSPLHSAARGALAGLLACCRILGH